MRRALVSLLVVCCAAELAPTGAFGDGPQTGTIEGTAIDAAGSPLPGVTVTLASERGEQSAVTGADGKFRFGILPPGAYTLRAALEGMQNAEVTVSLATGGRENVSLPLGVTTSETIQVTAEAPLINKFETSTNSALQAEVAESLAFTGRNYQSATYALPGVVHVANSQSLADHRPSVNGGLWMENSNFIDGVDTSNTRRGGSSRIFLPTTAVSELRMDSSAYTAEYGRVTGGITGVVTKSGTNQFHGEALYVAQNPKWRAQSDEVPLPREDDISNSYELAIGGPLYRDRAWFFVGLADNTTNEIEATVDGSIIDSSIQSEARLLKLNFQPSQRHQLALTGIDAPTNAPNPGPNFADPFAVPNFALGGEFVTVGWSFAVNNSQFLEVRAADQSSTEDRTQLATRALDPSKPAHTPLNSTFTFWDLQTLFRWNAIANPLGTGVVDFPRQQANATYNWFLPKHELKFGADYQDVAWETLNQPPDRASGRNYNPNLPGGFVQPQRLQRFLPAAGVIETNSEALGIFAQDKISPNNRFTIVAGVRYDDQAHDNDIGEEVASSSDLAPRLALIYDLHGDGKLLLKGTGGRYYHHITQNIVNEDAARLDNGANSFDEFNWNPATRLYDRFVRRVTPATNSIFNDIDPYYKDEYTAGIEWQFAERWAFKARAIYWKLDDLFSSNQQILADGTIVVVVDNIPEAERDYQAVQLELNRQFRDNWVLRMNYTNGKVEGNLFGNAQTTLDNDDFLEARRAINPASGEPFTAEFRDGRGLQDVEHIFNAAATKMWDVGKHTFQVGGLFWFRSGTPWGLRPSFTVTTAQVPNIRGTLNTTRYTEPRDANDLPDTMNLNVTGSWRFPLGSRLAGNLRVEVANLTDEQEPIDINLATGRFVDIRASYQEPREVRAIVGLSF